MQSRSIIREKSYALAVQIVRVCGLLQEKREYILSRQLLRSGTSIGANIHEARYGQSKPDFIAKLSISLKETYETQYWIKLLLDTGYLQAADVERVQHLLRELVALLIASIKTAKKNSI